MAKNGRVKANSSLPSSCYSPEFWKMGSLIRSMDSYDYCVYQNFNCKRDFVCLWDQVLDVCYQGSYCGNWLVKSKAVSASCNKTSTCTGY